VADLIQRLLHRTYAVQEQAVVQAVRDRAEDALVAALEAAKGWHRVVLAAALGDLRAPGSGDAALRACLAAAGPGTQDLRCASVVSLTKRLGAGATPDLRAALVQRDTGVREYAVVGLAAVGGAEAWPDVLAWLRARRAPTRGSEPPTRAAVHYLLRHLPTCTTDERAELVRVLHKVWGVLEQDGVTGWLSSVWPGVEPGSAGLGEPAALTTDEWSGIPLFAADAHIPSD
jgi:hypothetical protein